MLKFYYFFSNNIKFLIFCKFIISFILIIILVLTLLQKNFINVYCLTTFNIILIFLFKNFLINKSFFVFSDINPAIYTLDTLLTFIFLQGFHYSIRYKFLYMFNLVFYTIILNIN